MTVFGMIVLIRVTSLVLLLSSAFCIQDDRSNAIPLVVVQLSDLHVSKYQENLPWGNITGDLQLFRDNVLREIHPDTILITGDLTDGKTDSGSGQQHEEEWMVYSNLLDPEKVESPILDVRGNHDSFNIYDPVCNYYKSYSVGPKRVQGRISVHALVEGHLHAFEDWLQHQQKCPLVVFFGIDASASLGLKSPTNFVALMNSKDVSIAAEEAKRVSHILSARDCRYTSIISYGHYPLSTFSTMGDSNYSHWYDIGFLGALRHALGSMYSIDNSLARLILEVSHVYVSGHLHAAFGERLHRVHSIAETESYLTELETAAWKDDRRFRIVAIDEDAQCMSFEDLYFNTETSPRMRSRRDIEQKMFSRWNESFSRNGWGLTTTGDGFIDGSIPIVTWPRDARYSMCQEHARSNNEIRSLVLFLDNVDVKNVTAYVHLDQEATMFVASFPMDVIGKRGHRILYRNQPRPINISSIQSQIKTRDVPIYIRIKVFGQTKDNRPYISSISQTRTANLQCDQRGEDCVIQPYKGQEPLLLSAIESLTLAVNWPNLAHRIYLALYCSLLLVLMIPKAILMTRYKDSIVQAHGNFVDMNANASFAKFILAPCTSFCMLSMNLSLWKFLVGYLLYIVLGPLYVADLLSGHSLFVVFHHGVLGYIKGEWVLVPTPDVLLVQVMHLLFCVYPMIIWLAVVVRYDQDYVPSNRWTDQRVILPIQYSLLALIVVFNIKVVYRKAYILMGYQCLLLSPGFAWTIPMFLFAARKHLKIHVNYSRSASKRAKAS